MSEKPENKNNGADTPAEPFTAKSLKHTHVGGYALPTYQLEGKRKPKVGATIALDVGEIMIEGVVNSVDNTNKVVLTDTKTKLKGAK